MAIEHDRIKKKYIILCEGIDVENFLIVYLNSDALIVDPRFSESIQTFDFGGNEELSNYLQIFRNIEDFDSVERLMVLRDAETDVSKAIHTIQNAFRNNGLPVPSGCNQWVSNESGLKVSFTLLPTCSSEASTGTLEDLCWDILNNRRAEDMKDDIREFINLVKEKYNSIGAHEHKSKLHTFFSVNNKFISMKTGEAAKAGAFDWNCEKLNELKEFIREGFD